MGDPVWICGDAERGALLVPCECGKHRQANRPHGFARAAGSLPPRVDDLERRVRALERLAGK